MSNWIPLLGVVLGGWITTYILKKTRVVRTTCGPGGLCGRRRCGGRRLGGSPNLDPMFGTLGSVFLGGVIGAFARRLDGYLLVDPRRRLEPLAVREGNRWRAGSVSDREILRVADAPGSPTP